MEFQFLIAFYCTDGENVRNACAILETSLDFIFDVNVLRK